ncbi:hypothetical protein OC846_002559 [Tilletia horrida]|uniref:Uncharacterized protein n=1 Tax=Tilletia horrida TaxID=155126 RepID=A0AAN6GWS0_9BASI|nr:hypothetical protein OC846_002559 [Tilletia horrida]KAK0567701.1 hypothetical protein OC861_002555 [Tilletia horrida]
MSANDPFGAITPRRPTRPARASIGAASSTPLASAGPDSSRYSSARPRGHASRPSLSGLDTEKTPRKPAGLNTGSDALPSPLLSDTSQSQSRNASGGSKSSTASSRATVGASRSHQASGSQSAIVPRSSESRASTSDRSARRSLIIDSSSNARGIASPALRSAPLAKRKTPTADAGEESFDPDSSLDNTFDRSQAERAYEADVSTARGATALEKQQRRRSAMHAQEVEQLRSESRLSSRAGYNDDDDDDDDEDTSGRAEQSFETSGDERGSRRRSGLYSSTSTARTSIQRRRRSLYQEDDDVSSPNIDREAGQRFPSRPNHHRHDTAESSGTAGGTDTSGTEGGGGGGVRGHSRTASRTMRNGDDYTSGSSGVNSGASGKRRRRKHSSASANHQRRDSNVNEFDQPHWHSAGARSRRISLTQQQQQEQSYQQLQQQQRNRMRSAESDVTAVRELYEPENPYRAKSVMRRSPLPPGLPNHERSATLSELELSSDRPFSSQGIEGYRPPERYSTDISSPRRHTPRLSVSRADGRDELIERAYTPHSTIRSSTAPMFDRAARTPDPNLSSGLVGQSSRLSASRAAVDRSNFGSSRGGASDDLSATVRPSLDGLFGKGSSETPLCDRNLQRAFAQFENYFSAPSVHGPPDSASSPGSAIRSRASSIATDAPTASGSGRSANGARTPSTPTSVSAQSAIALADSVELVACFRAVTLMASNLNSGLRQLREEVNEAHVDADVHNNPLATTLWRVGKDLGQLVKASDTQLRNLTEGMIAFKRADRERERVRRVTTTSTSENGSVMGGGGGAGSSSNRSSSRLGSLMLAQRSPGSESRRNGREAAAARASISEYRRNGPATSSSSNLGVLERERDRMMTSPTAMPTGRLSTTSNGIGSGAAGATTPAAQSAGSGNGSGSGNLFSIGSSSSSLASRNLTMERKDSNHSGSTTTSVSPRPPDTPTPMSPNISGQPDGSGSMVGANSLSSRLRNAIGDRLSSASRHSRSASEVVTSPVTNRSAASLSRVTGASAARAAAATAAAVGAPGESLPEEKRSRTSIGSGSIGRRAGASTSMAMANTSTGSMSTSPTSTRMPAPLSPRRSKPALPALTKNM